MANCTNCSNSSSNIASSCGICDNRSNTCILANRIFDNVRMDLDRDPFIINTQISQAPETVTPLYAGGTGTIVPSSLTVTPHFNDSYADICGNLELPGSVTYLFEGTRYTASCTLIVPLCLQMKIPGDSVWPFEVTVHFSYFADSLTYQNDNSYSAAVDGVVIVYITACMPVCLSSAGQISFNTVAQRSVPTQNAFIGTAFYPSASTEIIL
mgnify:CR=1 FL=1